eukprot:591680-Pyramimonas_sp.AAC.1
MSHGCRCKPRCGHNDDSQRSRAHAIDAKKRVSRTRAPRSRASHNLATAFVWFTELRFSPLSLPLCPVVTLN